jgi:hypothetical protein
MTTKVWFPNNDYASLEIKQFKSIENSRIMASAIINDAAMIKRVMDRIEEIPADGEMKVVFDTKKEKMTLHFSNEMDILTVEVYDHRFKTPSGGFHTNNNPLEIALYEDLDTLIHPNRKKKFAKLTL